MKSLCLFICVLIINTISLSQNFPSPNGYINDFADVLADSQESELENVLSSYDKKTTVEIAVVTIKNLDGNSIEEYTNKLSLEWGVGKKKNDNGLVILNSIEDRKWRIEVGYGLEEFLPDATCKSIGDNNLSPNLKNEKYYDAYKNTVNNIIQKLGGFTEEDKARLKEESNSGLSTFWIIGIVILVIIIFALIGIFSDDYSSGSSYGGSSYGSGGFGSGSGGFGGGSFGGGGASGGY